MANLETKEEPFTTELITWTDKGADQHALEETGHTDSILRTAFVSYDQDKRVAVITAHVLLKTLHIRHVFIEAPYRGHGLGTVLVEKTLEYGKNHGCTFAFVETMNFQALGFYQKLGFELEFTREGFAHNASLHYLKKDL